MLSILGVYIMTAKKEAVDQSVEDKAQTNATPTATTGAPASDAPPIQLQDLAIILNIVNIAIKRGTYETNELRSVLDAYEKLEAFLKYQADLQAKVAQQGEA